MNCVKMTCEDTGNYQIEAEVLAHKFINAGGEAEDLEEPIKVKIAFFFSTVALKDGEGVPVIEAGSSAVPQIYAEVIEDGEPVFYTVDVEDGTMTWMEPSD